MRAAEPLEFHVSTVVELLIGDGVEDGLADQDLAAVGCGGNPRRHRYVAPEQIIAAPHGLPRVDADAHANTV
jgi:hypothetical protein